MRALSGALGAIAGAIIGGIAALWFVGVMSQGDDFGAGLAIMILGPVGLLMGLIAGRVCGLKAFDFQRRPDPEGKLTSKKWALRGMLYVVLPLLTVWMFYSWEHHDDPPSDAARLAHFKAHRAQFDELAQMVRHDKGLRRVDQNATDPGKPQAVGVPPARIADYRQKLRAVGVARGFEVQNKDHIDFYYFLEGCAICDDTEKNFTYRTKPPTSVLSSLDTCGPKNCGPAVYDGPVYRHIDGPWYLSYRFIPD